MTTEVSVKPDRFGVVVGNVIESCAAIGGFILIGTNLFKENPSVWAQVVNSVLGLVLIGGAVFLYHNERTREIQTGLMHGAFNAITQALQRESEQLPSMGTAEKTAIVANNLDRAYDKFFHLLRQCLSGKF